MTNEQRKKLEQDIKHNKKLLEGYGKRKRALEVRQSKYGLDVPPHVTIELEEINKLINDTNSKVVRWQKQLESLTLSQPAGKPQPPENKLKPQPPEKITKPGTPPGSDKPGTPPGGYKPQPPGQGGAKPPSTVGGNGRQGRAEPPKLGQPSPGGRKPEPPNEIKKPPMPNPSPKPAPSVDQQISRQLPNVLCIVYMEGYQKNSRVYVYGSVLGHHVEALVREAQSSRPVDIVKEFNFRVIEQGKNTPTTQVQQRIDETHLFDHKLTRVRLFPPTSQDGPNAPVQKAPTQAGLFDQFRRTFARFFGSDAPTTSFTISGVATIHLGMIAVFNPAAYAGGGDDLYITAKLAQRLFQLNTNKLAIFAVSKQGMAEDKIPAGDSLVAVLKRLFPRQQGA